MSCEEAGSDHVYLKVEVTDTGVGMTEEEIAQVFTPFAQGEHKDDQPIEGTGLGLNIVTNLLKLMGSQLRVESAPQKGSDFSFVILQEIRKRINIGEVHFNHLKSQLTENEYQVSFVAPEARILVVDDMPTNLLVMKGLLEPTMVQVDTATNGRAALELLEEHTYDLCLLDHLMPDMDGIALFKNMETLKNTKNRTIPVVIVTANGLAGARAKYMELGFTDFLPKPIDAMELERTVRDYLPREKVKNPFEG